LLPLPFFFGFHIFAFVLIAAVHGRRWVYLGCLG
jgi:hypothetical protein